ncbi:MAG: exopolysaccharide biosynthesis polyprenyl glycosylphosphotransferase [Bdellovibrionales bacterium]
MIHIRTSTVILLKTLSLALDFLAFFISIYITAFLLPYLGLDTNYNLGDTFRTHTITFALAISMIGLLLTTGEYRKRKPIWEKILRVVKLCFIMLAIDIITRSAANYGQPSLYPLVYWPVSLSLLVVFCFVLNSIKNHVPGWQIPAVIIGDVNIVTHILHAIATDRGMGYAPHRVLMRGDVDKRFDKDEAPLLYRDIQLQDGRENYADFIKDNLDNHFIISMDTFRGDERDDLLRLLNEQNARFSLVPMISQMSLYQKDPLYFFGHDVMFIETKRYKLTIWEKAIKRGVDILGASVGLLILGLPMALIAWKLRQESPDEDVLYCGDRVGQHLKTFKCLKFRTMESNSQYLLDAHLAANPEDKAYWDRFLKLPNDPRVRTKMTKFIRQKSLDELPQLWNVLKGEMSLVGPRPILTSEIGLYGDPIKYYETMRPGLTGLWQVSGRSETSFMRRVVWDRWYVRNWSFWGDIVIIIKTIFVVLCGKGAT